MTKPKILLCWPYNRLNWVKIFNVLKDDFDFVFLNYLNQEQDVNSFTDCTRIYWFDFKNVNEIIEKVNPDKVVFMGIDNPLTITLNQFCKKKKIPTFFLQHGIFHPFKAYLEEEKMEKVRNKMNVSTEAIAGAPKSVNKLAAIKFLGNSFSLKTAPAFFTIAQIEILVRTLHSHPKAFFYTKHSSRRASKYIVFTKYCSRALVDRDGVRDESLCEVGNPEADEVLQKMQTVKTENLLGDYFLLIDDPLGASFEFGSAGIFAKEVVDSFYKKLNEYALLNNKKLLIKLHPNSYKSDTLYVHPNIVYLREVGIAEMIKNSSGVFGGLSTLLIPALASRPCCLFKYSDNYDLHHLVEAIQYCPVLQYQHFDIKDIHFYSDTSVEKKQQFIEKYLYKNDGQAIDRIRIILAN